MITEDLAWPAAAPARMMRRFQAGRRRGGVPAEVRRARETAGRIAEWIAAFALLLRGYRIVARRLATPYGEIDLVAARGRRLAFVEVKQRRTLADAELSLSEAQTRRLHAAAQYFVKRRRRYRGCRYAFDAILVAPWQWPRHARDILQPPVTSLPW